VTETNWAGNVAYSAPTIHRPTTLEQVQDIVRGAERVRVLGARHTFNAIADSAQLVSLAGLPQAITVDRVARTASVPAGLRYGDLAQQLEAEGLALHNLASLPHVSVGGAVATGTHGSGDRNGSLSTAVAGLELVTSNGDLLRVARGEPDFEGMVVGLGALGAVTRLTLDVEPTYTVRQTVYEGLDWQTLYDHFDAVTSSGYSVSLFTTWGATIEQVWVKRRETDAQDTETLFGAPAARRQLHPAPGADPENCTAQQGQPGIWWQRLPHFRLEFEPSVGDELQAEYMVPRGQAVAAIEVVRGLADRIRPLLLVSEIRTVAADGLWMSPEFERETVCLHFTWRREQAAVEAVLSELEARLAPFEARPHWGKLFAARAECLAQAYPRLPEFLRLVERLDPRGAFSNSWFDERVRL
jgi:alditol oxidase